MLRKDGLNGAKETTYTLFVPEEHCVKGLEVNVRTSVEGMVIGGELIGWDEIDIARLRVKGYEI